MLMAVKESDITPDLQVQLTGYPLDYMSLYTHTGPVVNVMSGKRGNKLISYKVISLFGMSGTSLMVADPAWNPKSAT